MIICTRCGKENQDQHKFCLRCGGELGPAAAPPPAPGPPPAMGPPPSDLGSAAMAKTMMADPALLPGNTPAAPAGGAPFGGAPFIAPTPFSPPGAAAPPPGMGMGMGGPPVPLPGMPPQKPKSTPGLPSPFSVTPSPSPFAQSTPAAPPPAAPPPAAFSPPPPAAAPIGPTTGQMAAGERPCPTCANPVPAGFKFCGNCGSKIEPLPAPAPAVQAPPPVAPAPVHVPVLRGRLTLIRPDGSEGGTFDVVAGDNKLGRATGTIFESDGYLSPTHAELHLQPTAARVKDMGSLNGVFVKMVGEEEIQPGDIFRIGQELMRFDTIAPPTPLEDGTEIMGSPNPGYWGRISVVIGKDIDGSAFPLLGDAVSLGRERGDINFPDDGYVSGLHARLTIRNGRYFLTDLGSSNGTFIKIRGERAVTDGSFILLGQQLFRLNYGVS